MYSQWHYLSRSAMAKEMSEQSENATQKKSYIKLSIHWKKLADAAASGFHPR